MFIQFLSLLSLKYIYIYIYIFSLSLSLSLGPPFSPSQSSGFMGFVASGLLRLAFWVPSVLVGHFWVKFRLGWVIARVSLLVHGGGYESLLGWVRWSMVVVVG